MEVEANKEKAYQKKIEILKTSIADLKRKLRDEEAKNLKLESDWVENAKHHEDEVQMRMKFEAKLPWLAPERF